MHYNNKYRSRLSPTAELSARTLHSGFARACGEDDFQLSLGAASVGLLPRPSWAPIIPNSAAHQMADERRPQRRRRRDEHRGLRGDVGVDGGHGRLHRRRVAVSEPAAPAVILRSRIEGVTHL